MVGVPQKFFNPFHTLGLVLLGFFFHQTMHSSASEKITPALERPAVPSREVSTLGPSPASVQPENQKVTKEAPAQQNDRTPTEHAFTALGRFLAGLPHNKGYEALETDPTWLNYQKALEEKWSLIKEARLTPMIEWRANALGQVSLPVFYPMGGPDVFNVLTFFPDSPEYILVGLERIGEGLTLEKLSKLGTVSQVVKNLEQGTSSLFQRSFFITKDMSRDFYSRGVLPAMLALISRLGYDVLDVKFVNYTQEGHIIEAPASSQYVGVAIHFMKSGSSQVQKIYYFRQNLHDRDIGLFAQFLTARRKPYAVLFKSSSYTPHQVGFSKLVELVETCAELILQDDSGIPYKLLKKNWDVTFYGKYTKPYGESFQAYVQKDLARIYAGEGPEKVLPLNFRIGYGYGAIPSCLQLARRKNSSASQ